MNYETETWYKLYIRESTEDRLLPAFNRALRDFLLRLAKSRNDGTLLRATENPGTDLARALNAHPDEVPLVEGYVRTMLVDGYLSHRRGRLWITNFAEAQSARSAGAVRQSRWRANKKPTYSNGASQPQTERRESDVTEALRSNVTRDAQVTSLPIRSDPLRSDPIRSETIRSDPTRERAENGLVAGDTEPEGDPGIGTICPANLADRLEKNGMVQRLAEHLGKPIDTVRDELARFVGYWTIGAGMGQKRTGWPGKARQWVIEQAGKPGGLRAPGLIEHERQAGYQVSASTASVLGGLLRGGDR